MMSEKVAVYPTGFPELDGALGIGGLPRGRVVEIFGPAGSSKTTLVLKVIAGVQKAGGVAAYIDAEHALDITYAHDLGVDPARLLVSQPDSGEQALEVADALARSASVDMIVVDSVAALAPEAVLEAAVADRLRVCLMAQAVRLLLIAAARTGTTVVFTNEPGGLPSMVPGRSVVGFYASTRLAVRCLGPVERDGRVVGRRIHVDVVKNDLALPGREAEFDILYGEEE